MRKERFRRWKRGERLSYSHVNVTSKVVEALVSLETSGGLSYQYSRAGTLLRQKRVPVIGVFELTEDMQKPDASRTEGTASEPDCMWVENARPILLYTQLYEYDVSGDTALSQTLYYPANHRNSSGIGIGIPPLADGDRCYCIKNPQSGRWEIISPPFGTWRFELKDTLSKLSNATAYLLEWTGAAYVADTDVEFEVYDIIGPTGTFSGVAGDQGYAIWMPDRGIWEIIQLSC